ncbi:3'-5' exonuclease [Marinospirillum sp. MEB164]|uniref:3'-5' exonuclease n=1 Tax=Marinospirillum alkalitolerans TaxID=3123374 RepID=A0ABW8PZW0_9GAMM
MELTAPNSVYLDLETTGLNCNGEDEVLEIALVGADGETLFHTLLKPERLKAWPVAESIHGISPDDVVGYPSLDEVLNPVIDLVWGRQLVIYNAPFDLSFLPDAVAEGAAEVRCCMLAFAQAYGEPDPKRGGFKWKKLGFAAEHVGHVWSGRAHSALADAQATRSVWQWLARQGAV